MFRRALSTWRPPVFDPLPPIPAWPTLYGQPKDRAFLHNQATANTVAASFLLGVKTPKVIIEAYPGVGVLTRALLQYPPSIVKSLIVLEDVPQLLPPLEAIRKADDRVVIVPRSGYEWSTYTHLETEQLLPGAHTPWEEEAPLQFIANLPHSIQGEQLISQLFRTIPERTWLFKFGRIRMSFIMAASLNARIVADSKSRQRCKLSVLANTTVSTYPALPNMAMSPFASNLYPLMVPGRRANGLSARAGQPHTAVTFDPLEKQYIAKGDTDKWDYILRSMFIRKTLGLRKVLPSLAPGAENLIEPLTLSHLPESDRVDVNKPIITLSPQDWSNVVKVFNNWKFAPKISDL
ncbi:S-adenosyl-L-methionine-dependent methyltransferase [Auriculariales sp. MPI-PUGE-AT-0066]|nr:S-adenosyl-L-methionine-dependent methyltransferase [Auriculariales sp. MPI-PUGE-AT-0066]